jgi:putative membrane protein
MTAAAFLILGWIAIRQKNLSAHTVFMSAALLASFLFLIFYLIHHFTVGVTRVQGSPFFRGVYFAILFTHTPLAAVTAPLSVVAVYYAVKGKLQAHIRLTRWLLPVWLYVSVTGVIIYWMLYRM